MSKRLFIWLCVFQVTFLFANTDRALHEGWKFRTANGSAYLPAVVPGTVHTDLLANKLISDPFLGVAERDLQWISDSTWEYRLSFDCSMEELTSIKQTLLFEGLDTYAKVWLNDSLILIADNMFRSWNAEVKGLLKAHNILRVVFEPVAKFEESAAAKLPYTLSNEHRIFTRKAQYQYGWDWGPRYITCGIWKLVHLITSDGARIGAVQAVQERLGDSLAEVRFAAKIDCAVSGMYLLELIPRDRKLPVLKQTAYLQVGINTVDIHYTIKNPERWWCNGMGEPAMYRFTIALKQGEEQLDESQVSIGLRTLELVREPDSSGVSFYFKLNGVPVFMKGANWVPADNFAQRVSAEKYASLLQDAVSANMNMLRVWGGGYYESDTFYEYCDQFGLLVWQDFMFACAMYPGDSAFMSTTEQEIRQQVERLRNHPSVALWCGNNEIAEGWNNWGWQKAYHLSSSDSLRIQSDYEALFNGGIPRVLSELDPTRSYIPSSPELGWGRAESMQRGDSHYWGVWWGMEPFEKYKEKTGRFVSEYGFQGMPSLSTLKRCCGDSALTISNACVQAHQKHPRGFQTIDEYMLRDYRKPRNFADYVYVSQLLQANGLRQAIESHRTKTPYCMGSLVWQLNDCWPVTSWSLIDACGSRKAAYYEVKRSFERVLITIEDKGEEVLVYGQSDGLANSTGLFSLQVFDFHGKRKNLVTKSTLLERGKMKMLYRFSKKEHAEFFQTISTMLIYASFRDSNNTFEAIHYLVRPKDMQLEKPRISIKQVGSTLYEITSDRLAKNVYVQGTNEMQCSDNFFDLVPGIPHRIRIESKTKIRLSNLRITSLFDTFNESTSAH